MRFWVEYMGPVWCGAVEDAEQALEHSTQAVRYVLQGKNDCLRSAAQVSTRDHNKGCRQTAPENLLWQAHSGARRLALIRTHLLMRGESRVCVHQGSVGLGVGVTGLKPKP